MLCVPYRFEIRSTHVHYIQAQQVIQNLIFFCIIPVYEIHNISTLDLGKLSFYIGLMTNHYNLKLSQRYGRRLRHSAHLMFVDPCIIVQFLQ
jgi:hypothetical protein